MAAEGQSVRAPSEKCPVPANGGGSRDRTKLRTEGEATLFIRKKIATVQAGQKTQNTICSLFVLICLRFAAGVKGWLVNQTKADFEALYA